MIRKSLANKSSSKGMTYGKGGADLIVAFMVVYQKPEMSADYRDYYGYGGDAGEITAIASR